ncbi:MAG: tRNA (guanosine(37)-N1)-methyltransferase TrmD [Candidatus Latescibacteria bacterium]|jgi:tRNA (guanine37-N1)-methyltransferase|nr:tRNA (guanosine(37)-N1)-methyltransferase TrmD [Candidatus Latescibacterota bacterium]MBT4140118.1 tRNA (guanosine(37)-N1)-methyltransferase TrmD [Candidatus Latescibacterota bacterium]MBT5830874.1 tRNA (guanosine(37)-N1)-methyltransferase TrmD [Candidatus Latescibacterota bacterium]
MRIDVISIFPKQIQDALSYSIPKRAMEDGLVSVHAHNLRDYTTDKHQTVDDTPYGGGAGMIFKPEPLARAIEDVPSGGRIIFLTPEGRRLDQSLVNELSIEDHLVMLCGHYRGIDERIRERYVTDEISVGDYVLSGGELPALVLIDAVIRLLPGAIGDAESALEDSFQEGLLDCAWYTRPRSFEGLDVPDVLLSGDHKKVANWRRESALERTRQSRPDLLDDK